MSDIIWPRFEGRLGRHHAFDRFSQIQTILTFLELINNVFQCVIEFRPWPWMQIIIAIILYVYSSSIIVRRCHDVGMSGHIGVFFLIASTILFVAFTLSTNNYLEFFILWIILNIVADYFILRKEGDAGENSYGSAPSEQMNLPKTVVVLIAVLGAIASIFVVECKPSRPSVDATPRSQSTQEGPPPRSIYRTCEACCINSGIRMSCDCSREGHGYICHGF